ncbi:MAG: hypothetical protein GX358_05995 [candidate division WS1 bacterium]|nr:hypothetical protein [candidate division WS1 bacterium]
MRARRLFSGSRHAAARLLIDVPADVVPSTPGWCEDTPLKRAIHAVDELTGLITACALVQPDKKLASVKVKSVKKKMKDRAFAAAVDRESITIGAEEMGLSLDEHIETVLGAMQGVSDELGL